MTPFVIRPHLSESTFAKSLALNGVAVATETLSIIGEIYWRWDDETSMKPEYLGKAVAGHSLRIPFDLQGRSVRLFLISKTGEGRRSVANITEAEQTVFSSPSRPYSSGTWPLFDHYSTETTAGTTQENFYAYTLLAGSLVNNGDKIRVEYSGTFTANTNTKRIFPKFAGTILATGQTSSATATDWTVDYYVIRVSNTVVRFGVEVTTNDAVLAVESGEITGLDLTANDYQIDLDARSVTAAGEVTGLTGYGVFILAV